MSSTSTKLALVFKDAENNNVNLNYKYAEPEVSASTVKTLTDAIVTNGSIFAKIPVSAKSAKIVTTTEDEIDIENE